MLEALLNFYPNSVHIFPNYLEGLGYLGSQFAEFLKFSTL